jgi:hypothetical protein
MTNLDNAVAAVNALSIPEAQKAAIIAQLVMQMAGTGTQPEAPKPGTPLVDPIVPTGTEGTVTLPKTGHVLSLPQPLLEGLASYIWRVRVQCGAADSADIRGALMFNVSALSDRFGGYKADGSNWPETADFTFNPNAYYSAEEKAKIDAAKAAWDAAREKIRKGAKHGGDVPISGQGIQK